MMINRRDVETVIVLCVDPRILTVTQLHAVEALRDKLSEILAGGGGDDEGDEQEDWDYDDDDPEEL